MEPLHIANDGARRVLVVANHSGIVYAFRRVLRQTSGFTLVGYVAGHAPVGAIVADARPDVVIVDDLGAPAEAVKRIACRALGSMGAEAKAAVPALNAALHDELPWVRWSAALALGRIGPDSKKAVPDLIKAMRRKEEYVVRHAAATATSYRPSAPAPRQSRDGPPRRTATRGFRASQFPSNTGFCFAAKAW